MVTITEHIERKLVDVDLTDDGRVELAVYGGLLGTVRHALTVEQARQVADELHRHASEAAAYLTEQAS